MTFHCIDLAEIAAIDNARASDDAALVKRALFLIFAASISFAAPSFQLTSVPAQSADGPEIPLSFHTDGQVFHSCSIRRAADEAKTVDDGAAVVVRARTATLVIEYPVDKPVAVRIHADTKTGFTRAGLIKIIGDVYKWMYSEEDRTTRTKVVPVGERKGLVNRNQTNGRFGIWGHDLSDLFLEGIHVRRDKKDVVITLDIGS